MVSSSSQDISKYLETEGIVHCSFDFWNTIGFSNPQFKSFRGNLIAKHIGLNVDLINSAIRTVGVRYNAQQENKVCFLSSTDLIGQVVDEVGSTALSISLSEIDAEIRQGFLRHPPLIHQMARELVEFCISQHLTLSITSNTAFIPGADLKKVLEAEFGAETFRFFLFSDELCIAKPNPQIFETCINATRRLHSGHIRKEQISHIGDDEQNDYLAALFIGVKAIKVCMI